jgi:DNA polymerase delta subunit 1
MVGGNRKPFDDGGGDEDGLCEECRQMGAAPGTLLSLMVENRDNEKRLVGAQSACMHCHSGGLYGKIMCTNTDCPVFYMRCEAPRAFRKLVSSMKKLEL